MPACAPYRTRIASGAACRVGLKLHFARCDCGPARSRARADRRLQAMRSTDVIKLLPASLARRREQMDKLVGLSNARRPAAHLLAPRRQRTLARQSDRPTSWHADILAHHTRIHSASPPPDALRAKARRHEARPNRHERQREEERERARGDEHRQRVAAASHRRQSEQPIIDTIEIITRHTPTPHNERNNIAQSWTSNSWRLQTPRRQTGRATLNTPLNSQD